MKKLRIPPYSEENEQAVLGSLLTDNNGFYKLDGLKANHFYYRKHQQIFQAISNIIVRMEKADLLTVHTELKEEIDLGTLAEMSMSSVSAYHINQYVKIVKNKFLSRQLIELGEQITNVGFKDSDTAVAEVANAKEMISDCINTSIEEKASDCKRLIETTTEHYLEKQERMKNGGVVGLDTGIACFEFEPKELIIISALPGVGKSILATNIASVVSKHSRTMFFSFEMSNTEIMYRLLSMTNNVPLSKFKYGEYSKEEVEQFMTRYKHECPLLKIYDATLTMAEVEIMCQKEKATNGLELVVIDYAQITADVGELVPKTQYVTRKAKQIAQDLNCVVVLISQFNQKAESEQAFPRRDQLLGGSSSVQNSSQIYILHNPTQLDSNSTQIDPIYILRKCKDRNSSNCRVDYFLHREQNYMNFKLVTQKPSYCE